MTFPRDESPAAGRRQRPAESEFQSQPPASGPHEAVSEADLFAADSPMQGTSAGGGGHPAPDGYYAYEPVDPSTTEPDAGRHGTRRRIRRVGWELLQTLVLAALIFLLVRAVAQNFRVEGPSMEPGLHNGQYLLVNKAVYFKVNLGTLSKYIPFIDAEDGEEAFLFHGPQRGDVIVFRYPKDPDRDFIKRVIGVPGDTIRIDESGVVYVNGEALEESYINDSSPRALEEQVVPPDSYFVLGDNRPNSSDSRNWGFVPEENIIGKAMLSYWPLSELGGVGNHAIDLGLITVPLP
jgi:signal peptidase I